MEKEKKEPSEKQKKLRAVADVVSKAIDRNLESTEWGQLGKMINNFGYPIVMDSAEKFAKTKMPVEEKRKCVVAYLFGILKHSKVPVERPESIDISDILGADRSM